MGRAVKKLILSVVLTALALPTVKLFNKLLPSFLPGAIVFSAVVTMPDGAAAYLTEQYFSQGTLPSLPNEESSSPEQESSQESSSHESSQEPSSQESLYSPEQSSYDDTEPSGSDTISPPDDIPVERLGKIIKKQVQIAIGGIFIGDKNGLLIKNSSNYSKDRILKEAALPHNIKIELSDEPQVLIYHTHATEAFDPYGAGFYDTDYSFRSTDNSLNMVAVGDVITQILNEYGISTLHSDTLHDNPLYNGAYSRSAQTINAYLKDYPSIKVILDVHRDAMQDSSGALVKPVVNINGEDVAQIMIISTCDSGSGKDPSFFENLRFAAELQRTLEADYPGITRPTMFCDRNYNQELSPGALLIEIGAHGNTLDEAKRSAELLAKTLVKVLKLSQ